MFHCITWEQKVKNTCRSNTVKIIWNHYYKMHTYLGGFGSPAVAAPIPKLTLAPILQERLPAACYQNKHKIS